MKTRCLRCDRIMIGPTPVEMCATCLHEANARLHQRRQLTQFNAAPLIGADQ